MSCFYTELASVCLFFVVVHAQEVPWFKEKNCHLPLEMDIEEIKPFALNTEDVSFESLLDPILIPRFPGTENSSIVREFIRKHMEGLCWTVETDAFQDKTPLGPTNFENVIATLNPETPRRLVLACHYDSKYFRDGSIFVGAIDSAVPCAMLLHLATVLRRSLESHNTSPASNVTLQFIFFDGEEAVEYWSDTDSLYGSRHLAGLWENTSYPPGNSDRTTALHRMDILVLLDLIGCISPTFSDRYESTSRWHADIASVESALRKAEVWTGSTQGNYMKLEPVYDQEMGDDQVPFVARNVNALHFITDEFPEVWHTPGDDRKVLDFDTIDNLNRIFRVFVARYLRLKVPPQ